MNCDALQLRITYGSGKAQKVEVHTCAAPGGHRDGEHVVGPPAPEEPGLWIDLGKIVRRIARLETQVDQLAELARTHNIPHGHLHARWCGAICGDPPVCNCGGSAEAHAPWCGTWRKDACNCTVARCGA